MHIDGPWLKDEHGRTLLLRGANVGGSSKVPAWPSSASRAQFYRHRDLSFVGRPFPLATADEHFARLRHWGLTFLRFIVTWEAIEHTGPGQYDEAYLDYLEQVIERAATYGLQLFIDPHQDVWSRLAGGDGAPGWTFEAIGFDVTRFPETGAATLHILSEEPFFKRWPANYTRLAAATMFTLFFGGNDFAPRTTVDGEPAQEFLQRHYINAMKQVARRLCKYPHVVGFDSLNEPSPGYIGWCNLNATDGKRCLHSGPTPTPFQAMLLGAGFPQQVAVWEIDILGPRRQGFRWLNQDRVRAWQAGRECVWRENGVWDTDGAGNPRLLQPEHFTKARGHTVDFDHDYLRPFINRYAREIRAVMPRSIIFIENLPNLEMPCWGPDDAPNIVNASHWYDMFTLLTRIFIPFFNVDVAAQRIILGSKQVRQSFVEQQARIKAASATRLGGVPTLLGEFGTPFNMPSGLHFALNWFGIQEQALDANLAAVEANLLGAVIWNYTADNTNCLGDCWNDEDLSIFSLDQQRNPADINSGGRALAALVRPYAQRIAGEPLHMSFDLRRKRFNFTFRHDPHVHAPTEIFVPQLHYARGCSVTISDGSYDLDLAQQRLVYYHAPDQPIHHIILDVPAAPHPAE